MNTNYEIYNYLNLINRRVAKYYKNTGRSPLPAKFSATTEAIKERIYLNQMQSYLSFPEYLFDENRAVKKRFKASLKQIKQLQAMMKYPSFSKTMSKKFATKFSTYLAIRLFVTKAILKEFKRYYFNECDAYIEICAIDAIFFKLLDGTFEPDFDVRLYIDGLEQKYNIFYQEYIHRLEEKVSEETKKKRAKKQAVQKQEIELHTRVIKGEAKKIRTALKSEKKAEKKKKSREVSTFKQTLSFKQAQQNDNEKTRTNN